MRGFHLIAHSDKGQEKVKEFEKDDKRAFVKRIKEDPLTISFLFKKKREIKAISGEAINTFVNLTMKARGCKSKIDYSVEVLE